MENDNPGYEVMQIQQDQSIIQFDAIERANVDSQVSTAKQYPRDIARCINNSIAMATIDYETAQSCGYALQRGGKPIHWAEILRNDEDVKTMEERVVMANDYIDNIINGNGK